jgi:hypothetical protein
MNTKPCIAHLDKPLCDWVGLWRFTGDRLSTVPPPGLNIEDGTLEICIHAIWCFAKYTEVIGEEVHEPKTK